MKSQSGFTLIELAIVIAIIGLIIGGIVIAQSMIRGAQVQSIITDETKYLQAANQFKEKYGYLPGDFPNATTYWGTNSAGCPDTIGNQSPGQATCNGDGNGIINGNDSVAEGTSDMWETFYAWQHLADAGYIEGLYTGGPGSNNWTQQIPGLNNPASKLRPGGFEWISFTSNGDNGDQGSTLFSGAVDYQQYLLFGAPSTNYKDLTGMLLTGPEAQSIDAKMDDGLPVTGNVLGTILYNAQTILPCTINSNAAYANDSVPECILLFKTSF